MNRLDRDSSSEDVPAPRPVLPLRGFGGRMGIDNFTLVVASGAVIGVLGTLFVYMWRQDGRALWFAWLAAAYLVATPAALLMAQRGHLPNIASMGGGTALLLLCFGCLWTASRVFGGRRAIWWPLVAVPALWTSSFVVPGFDGAWLLALRVVLASVPAAAFFFLGAWELWRGRDEILPSRNGAIAFHLTGGAFFTFRIFAVAVLPFPMGGQDMHPVATGIFNLVTFVHALFISVLMISLTKERKESEQRALAESDALTGLPNRRAFASEAERLLRRQKNTHAPLALLILDLDHFKSINDRFGHDAGDRVLVEFGAVLSQCLRETDHRFRMGGEEFCCLLPGLTMREAQAVAERICEAFQATAVNVLGGSVRGTVSIGISSSDICGYVMEDLLSEADAATYEAKASGRNRAVLAIAKPKPPVVPVIDNVTDIRGRLRA